MIALEDVVLDRRRGGFEIKPAALAVRRVVPDGVIGDDRGARKDIYATALIGESIGDREAVDTADSVALHRRHNWALLSPVDHRDMLAPVSLVAHQLDARKTAVHIPI